MDLNKGRAAASFDKCYRDLRVLFDSQEKLGLDRTDQTPRLAL
jgi:hypothetical protein